MNILIDTNIIYALSGVRPTNLDRGKILDLRKSHKITMASISIAECVLSCHDDLSEIRMILEWTKEFVDDFVSCGSIEMNEDDILTLYYAKSITNIQSIVEKWRERKINAECEFGNFFIYMVSMPLAQLKLEKLRKTHSDQVGIYAHQLTSFFNPKCEFFSCQIRQTLEEEYSTQDGTPQKAAKSKYLFSIHAFEEISNIMFRAAKENTSIFDKNVTDEQKKRIFSKEGHASKIRIPKSVTHKLLYETVKPMYEKPEKFKDDKYMVNYMLLLTEKMLTEGAVFKINDVRDLMIISALNQLPEPSALFTADDSMKKYLKSIGKLFELDSE